MKQIPLELSGNNDYFINLFEWEFKDLFEESFHDFLNSIIDEATEYIDETISTENPSLSRKQIEKTNNEYVLFLWKMTQNKIKYYFLFNFKSFKSFISLLHDQEYEYFRKLIISFQTENIITFLLNDVVYRQVSPTFQYE
ncbi:hypothetical protein M0P65_06530 [Candidatus Gracilibacteria bacterium]|jgi:hypothetical protein|nr:hypothetical protein [Candidatus Gracilibacteria bacterium]